MNVLNPSLSILIEITSGKSTFHDAVKAFFDDAKNEQVEKSTTSVYVGCVLRHYYVLMECAKEFDPNATIPCKLAIGLAISNGLFLKRYSQAEVIAFVKQVFLDENVDFVQTRFTKFLKGKTSGEPLIRKDVETMSLDFIAQRYNIPCWISKMWSNNFSKNATFRIARAMNKTPYQFVRVNDLLTDREKLLAANPEELQNTDFSSSLLKYVGKEHVRRKKFVTANRAYQMSVGVKEFIDKLPIDTYKPVVVYSGNYNLVPLELAVTYKNGLKIENLCEPNRDMYIFKNNLGRYQVKNVRTTECTVSQFVTAISDKVGMFILMPRSSAFDRLRIDPDYFLTFKAEQLDALIENQNKAINEAANFIQDKGYLAYAVPTIDKKEGQNVISSFLRSHKDFELIEEVQHFPYDVTNSTLYYAILRKKGQNE